MMWLGLLVGAALAIGVLCLVPAVRETWTTRRLRKAWSKYWAEHDKTVG